mmetsp:Transcript_14372/g.24472  ORF Transcript_14372/g.24472 Transcript_14372/m.24472 type:complete len:293 (-) Transcript_14372:35-913(-)
MLQSQTQGILGPNQTKPIQKMIKSGSQVLGKVRPRQNFSRKEMLRQLNDKKDKMSQLVEAAHGTKGTSNEKYEKTTSTKKSGFNQDILNNIAAINDFSTHMQQFEQLEAQNHGLFQNASHQVNVAVRDKINGQFDCEAIKNIMGTQNHSAERAQQFGHQQQMKHFAEQPKFFNQSKSGQLKQLTGVAQAASFNDGVNDENRNSQNLQQPRHHRPSTQREYNAQLQQQHFISQFSQQSSGQFQLHPSLMPHQTSHLAGGTSSSQFQSKQKKGLVQQAPSLSSGKAKAKAYPSE